MSEVNEVQFTANVKSWIDAICAQLRSADPAFPFLGAEIEVRGQGKVKRRDLILRPVQNPRGFALTGEVKLPDRPDGKSPYNEPLVLDAHERANSVGAEFFFTWNVNRFVLWQTFKRDAPITDRHLTFWDWSNITDSSEVTRPEIEESLKRKWEEFLVAYAEIYRGAKPFIRRPLDQWFIHMLEAALDRPSVVAHGSVSDRYDKDALFRAQLDNWMVRNLGAVISEDEQADNLRRAARYSCYVLTNRIVFYDALRRKYPNRLKALSIPKSIRRADQVQALLQSVFGQAIAATEDYETVFRGDEFGDGIPFLSDAAADAWRDLAAQVDAYDFTRLDYDIIGQVFDGLISPRERHRFGQHYTKSQIVDLINAFTIHSPRATVLDPACGGGTFLMRAYARKKFLAAREGNALTHISTISDLYGVDLSSYAVHLSTISLATRDLVHASNYPRVACGDFFEVSKGEAVFPAGISATRDDFRRVPLPMIDALVGNPPYIRQERLLKAQKRRYYERCVNAWDGIRLSGRSDIHVYFWPYAASFLSENGCFGFLTSSSWLDVEYGFDLQRWVLCNFRIIAIMESSVEPWFTDARVATAVTILRRESDIDKRLNTLVRFVQIRRPLEDILLDYQKGDGDAARLEAAERIRDYLESVTQNVENANWRIRVVRQRDLINHLDLSGDEDDEDLSSKGGVGGRTNGVDPALAHTGAKWGIHLRAPDVFFDLIDLCGDRLVPLGEIARIRYGVKSGCDDFFYPRDVTNQRLAEFGPTRFHEVYGLTVSQTEKIRVCIVGDGSPHLIEKEYLEPVVHSVLDLETGKIVPGQLEQSILLVGSRKSTLRGKHVLRYLFFGEENSLGSRSSSPVHTKSTVAAREREGRFWYDLTDGIRPAICWPKAHQYKHIVPRNAQRLICNCRLYGVDPFEDVDPDLLHRVLQSTIVATMKHLFGRFTGREGNLDTMVCDVKMMPVPDVRKFGRKAIRNILRAGKNLDAFPSRDLREEMASPERRALDDAVLFAVGVEKADDRDALLDALYSQMTLQLDNIRRLELLAQKNRLRAARKGKSTPQSIGAEIWETLETKEAGQIRLFPRDFLPMPGAPHAQTFQIPEGRPRLLGMFDNWVVQIGNESFQMGEKARADLLIAVAVEGYAGILGMPQSSARCLQILNDWAQYQSQLQSRFEELATQRTADRVLIDRIVPDLWRRYRQKSS